jgi:hypothetical protein
MSERLWGILEKPNLTPTTVVQGSTFSTDISTIPLHPRIYWLLFWVAKLNQFWYTLDQTAEFTCPYRKFEIF